MLERHQSFQQLRIILVLERVHLKGGKFDKKRKNKVCFAHTSPRPTVVALDTREFGLNAIVP